MIDEGLGKVYHDGEVIIQEGEVAESLFVIQEGRAEVLVEKDGREVRLRIAESGEILGEMAVLERGRRSATVRALGNVRVLTVDKKIFLRRISEDPSAAFRMLEDLSARVRELSIELAKARSEE